MLQCSTAPPSHRLSTSSSLPYNQDVTGHTDEDDDDDDDDSGRGGPPGGYYDRLMCDQRRFRGRGGGDGRVEGTGRTEAGRGRGEPKSEWVTLSKTMLMQLVERICKLSFQADVPTYSSPAAMTPSFAPSSTATSVLPPDPYHRLCALPPRLPSRSSISRIVRPWGEDVIKTTTVDLDVNVNASDCTTPASNAAPSEDARERGHCSAAISFNASAALLRNNDNVNDNTNNNNNKIDNIATDYITDHCVGRASTADAVVSNLNLNVCGDGVRDLQMIFSDTAASRSSAFETGRDPAPCCDVDDDDDDDVFVKCPAPPHLGRVGNDGSHLGGVVRSESRACDKPSSKDLRLRPARSPRGLEENIDTGMTSGNNASPTSDDGKNSLLKDILFSPSPPPLAVASRGLANASRGVMTSSGRDVVRRNSAVARTSRRPTGNARTHCGNIENLNNVNNNNNNVSGKNNENSSSNADDGDDSAIDMTSRLSIDVMPTSLKSGHDDGDISAPIKSSVKRKRSAGTGVRWEAADGEGGRAASEGDLWNWGGGGAAGSGEGAVVLVGQMFFVNKKLYEANNNNNMNFMRRYTDGLVGGGRGELAGGEGSRRSLAARQSWVALNKSLVYNLIDAALTAQCTISRKQRQQQLQQQPQRRISRAQQRRRYRSIACTQNVEEPMVLEAARALQLLREPQPWNRCIRLPSPGDRDLTVDAPSMTESDGKDDHDIARKSSRKSSSMLNSGTLKTGTKQTTAGLLEYVRNQATDGILTLNHDSRSTATNDVDVLVSATNVARISDLTQAFNTINRDDSYLCGEMEVSLAATENDEEENIGVMTSRVSANTDGMLSQSSGETTSRDAEDESGTKSVIASQVHLKEINSDSSRKLSRGNKGIPCDDVTRRCFLISSHDQLQKMRRPPGRVVGAPPRRRAPPRCGVRKAEEEENEEVGVQPPPADPCPLPSPLSLASPPSLLSVFKNENEGSVDRMRCATGVGGWENRRRSGLTFRGGVGSVRSPRGGAGGGAVRPRWMALDKNQVCSLVESLVAAMMTLDEVNSLPPSRAGYQSSPSPTNGSEDLLPEEETVFQTKAQRDGSKLDIAIRRQNSGVSGESTIIRGESLSDDKKVFENLAASVTESLLQQPPHQCSGRDDRSSEEGEMESQVLSPGLFSPLFAPAGGTGGKGRGRAAVKWKSNMLLRVHKEGGNEAGGEEGEGGGGSGGKS